MPFRDEFPCKIYHFTGEWYWFIIVNLIFLNSRIHCIRRRRCHFCNYSQQVKRIKKTPRQTKFPFDQTIGITPGSQSLHTDIKKFIIYFHIHLFKLRPTQLHIYRTLYSGHLFITAGINYRIHISFQGFVG